MFNFRIGLIDFCRSQVFSSFKSNSHTDSYAFPTGIVELTNGFFMNAIQPLTPSLSPTQPRQRVTPRHKKRHQRQPSLALAVETMTKLTVNLVLSGAAISALGQYLPHYLSVQEKLREIRAEVKITEGRVNRLQAEFSRLFDPQQTPTIMQEQSDRVDPSQRQIVWMEKSPGDVNQSNQNRPDDD